jgi:hypothetical protein
MGTLNEKDFDDFYRFFNPEPGVEYTVIFSGWEKFYKTYMNDRRPSIKVRALVVNGETYANPKEWDITAIGLVNAIKGKILEAQRLGYNAVSIRFSRGLNNRYEVKNVEILNYTSYLGVNCGQR